MIVYTKNEDAFTEVINRFSTDPIAIVNEGLLVYLDEGQKQKLCAIIHNLLSEREGYWITTDIYIKKVTQDEVIEDFYDERGKRFLAELHVEENKFESFKEAEVFFKNCGFDIYKKIETSAVQLSSIKLLKKIPNLKVGDIKEGRR